MGDADKNHAFGPTERFQAALEHLVFTLAFLKANQLQIMVHLELANGGDKGSVIGLASLVEAKR